MGRVKITSGNTSLAQVPSPGVEVSLIKSNTWDVVAAGELGIFVKPISSLTFKCLALGVGHHVRDYGESTHVGLGQLLIGCSIVIS